MQEINIIGVSGISGAGKISLLLRITITMCLLVGQLFLAVLDFSRYLLHRKMLPKEYLIFDKLS